MALLDVGEEGAAHIRCLHVLAGLLMAAGRQACWVFRRVLVPQVSEPPGSSGSRFQPVDLAEAVEVVDSHRFLSGVNLDGIPIEYR